MGTQPRLNPDSTQNHPRLNAYSTTQQHNTPNTTGPFSFEIPSDPDKFTNAQSLRLHGRMRIKKRNPITEVLSNLTNKYVAPINNIFDSLWSSINIKLNGCEITDPSSKWYAYKAYFENHISYSSSCKENVLSYRGYYKDRAGNLMKLEIQ